MPAPRKRRDPLHATLPALRGTLADPSPALALLWGRYHARRDPADFHELALHYAPLAFIVGWQLKRRRPEFYVDELDDLVSDGLIALLRAIAKTDRPDGLGFVTYAKAAIRRGVRRAAENRTWMGSRVHRRVSLIASLRAGHLAEHGELPTRAELVALLAPHITNAQIQVGDEWEPDVGPLTADARRVRDALARSPEDEAASREAVRVAMRGLDAGQRRILRLVIDGHSTADIGKLTGLTHTSATKRVRGLLWELRSRRDLAALLGVEPPPPPKVTFDGVRRKVYPPIGSAPPARLVG